MSDKPFGLAICVLAALSGPMSAAAQPQRYATCVVTTQFSDVVAERARAGCDTGGGGTKSCSVAIGPTKPEYKLDRTVEEYRCYRLDCDNPCAFTRADALVFESDVKATRTFTAWSCRVTMEQFIGQRRIKPEVKDGSPFEIFVGSDFGLTLLPNASATFLKCITPLNERIEGIVKDKAHISDRIRFKDVKDGQYIFSVVPKG